MTLAIAPPQTGVLLAGQLGGTIGSPDVRGLRETDGPTLLALGDILDGENLQRSGSSIIGAVGGGGGAREFVSKTVITGAPAAVLDLTGIDGSAPRWEADFLINVTANTALSLVVGLSAAFKSTNYRYHASGMEDTAAAYAATVATADSEYIPSGVGLDLATDQPAFLRVVMHEPASTTQHKLIEWYGVYWNAFARTEVFSGVGGNDQDSVAYDTLRLSVFATTLAIGTRGILYKIKDS